MFHGNLCKILEYSISFYFNMLLQVINILNKLYKISMSIDFISPWKNSMNLLWFKLLINEKNRFELFFHFLFKNAFNVIYCWRENFQHLDLKFNAGIFNMNLSRIKYEFNIVCVYVALNWNFVILCLWFTTFSVDNNLFTKKTFSATISTIPNNLNGICDLFHQFC